MALAQDMARLRGAPVFACLDDEALRLLAFSAEPRRIAPGHVIFRRGEPATGAVLVVSGTLALDEEREDDLSVRWAGPGTLLDEAALLAEAPRRHTATADGEAVVVAVSRSSLMRALEAHPANAGPLRRYWAGQLRDRLAAAGASSDRTETVRSGGRCSDT